MLNMSRNGKKIKKIELEHDWYLNLLQTLIIVLSSIAIFAIGFYAGKGSLGDTGTLGWIVALVVIISLLVLIVAWKCSNIRNKLGKGQAVPSGIGVIIAFLILIVLVGSISYGSFENLQKEWFTHLPYLKNVYNTGTDFYYGQSLSLYYTIRNPGNNYFTPSIAIYYDKSCLSSNIAPLIKNVLNLMPAKSETTYYITFTVVNNGCQTGSSTLKLSLYKELENTPLSESTLTINIIRPTMS
jgi:hypothetical protein